MSIFPLEKREMIKTKMLNIGIQLIQEKGLQHISVSEITRLTGIGKGTFYHFFDSKEQYLYEVIIYSKEVIFKELNQLVKECGYISRKNIKQILEKYSMMSKNNIINYISSVDEQWLAGKLSMATFLNPEKEKIIIRTILNHAIGVREDIDILVISNMMKIMALVVESREYLYKDVLDKNMKMLQEQLIDYIFEKEV